MIADARTKLVLSTVVFFLIAESLAHAAPTSSFDLDATLQKAEFVFKGEVLSVSKLGPASRYIHSTVVEGVEYIARCRVGASLKGSLPVGSEQDIVFWMPTGTGGTIINVFFTVLSTGERAILFVRAHSSESDLLELADVYNAKLPAFPESMCPSINNNHENVREAILDHIQCVLKQPDDKAVLSMLEILAHAKTPIKLNALLPCLEKLSSSDRVEVVVQALTLRLKMRDVEALQSALHFLRSRAADGSQLHGRCEGLAHALGYVADELSEQMLHSFATHPYPAVREVREGILAKRAKKAEENSSPKGKFLDVELQPIELKPIEPPNNEE